VQLRRLFYKVKGFRRTYEMLQSLRKYQLSEVAQQRKKIIDFYDQFGEPATLEAFGADRRVISRWKQRLGPRPKLADLAPTSTRPRHVRTSTVSITAVDFIRNLRLQHPRLGKEKIKVFLDPFCKTNGLPPLSVSTIGRTLRRHQLFFQKAGRVYHSPDSKWNFRRYKTRYLRIRHSPKPQDFGHILSDAVELITDNTRHFFLSAIDAKLKFALTLNYKSLTSRNMKDFYSRFRQVYPLPIHHWQSDNGHENLGEFHAQLESDRIPHLFSYPRCPKINAFIERYNRTLREEFINNHLDIIHDKALFHKALAEFLIYYNTQRPHKSLGLLAPLQYLRKNSKMSHMCWTHTNT
jgi:transposase InsO family protein